MAERPIPAVEGLRLPRDEGLRSGGWNQGACYRRWIKRPHRRHVGHLIFQTAPQGRRRVGKAALRSGDSARSAENAIRTAMSS